MGEALFSIDTTIDDLSQKLRLMGTAGGATLTLDAAQCFALASRLDKLKPLATERRAAVPAAPELPPLPVAAYLVVSFIFTCGVLVGALPRLWG